MSKTKQVVVQQVLVTIRSDGRYSDQQLADQVGIRVWTLDGVAVHGVDAVIYNPNISGDGNGDHASPAGVR